MTSRQTRPKRIARSICFALLLGTSTGLSGCFDSRNVDMTYATAVVPKNMMKFKVGENAVQYELYSYSKQKGYDFYVGMVKDTYGNGQELSALAREKGSDRYMLTGGQEGDYYVQGMVFDDSGKAVLLSAQYGDASLTPMFEQVFESIHFKDEADYPSETPGFLQ